MSLDAARHLADPESHNEEPDDFYMEPSVAGDSQGTLRSVWVAWPQGDAVDWGRQAWHVAVLGRLAGVPARGSEHADEEEGAVREVGEIQHLDSYAQAVTHVDPNDMNSAVIAYPQVARLKAATLDAFALRIGTIVGVSGVFASIALLLVSTAVGLAGMYFGFAVLAFANYAAWRRGEAVLIIGPAVSGPLVLMSLCLAATCVLAAIF